MQAKKKENPNIVSICISMFQAKNIGTHMGKDNYRISYFLGEWKVIETCQPFSEQQERAAETTAAVIPDVFLSDQ